LHPHANFEHHRLRDDTRQTSWCAQVKKLLALISGKNGQVNWPRFVLLLLALTLCLCYRDAEGFEGTACLAGLLCLLFCAAVVASRIWPEAARSRKKPTALPKRKARNGRGRKDRHGGLTPVTSRRSDPGS
jgi:hypothetical protein